MAGNVRVQGLLKMGWALLTYLLVLGGTDRFSVQATGPAPTAGVYYTGSCSADSVPSVSLTDGCTSLQAIGTYVYGWRPINGSNVYGSVFIVCNSSEPQFSFYFDGGCGEKAEDVFSTEVCMDEVHMGGSTRTVFAQCLVTSPGQFPPSPTSLPTPRYGYDEYSSCAQSGTPDASGEDGICISTFNLAYLGVATARSFRSNCLGMIPGPPGLQFFEDAACQGNITLSGFEICATLFYDFSSETKSYKCRPPPTEPPVVTSPNYTADVYLDACGPVGLPTWSVPEGCLNFSEGNLTVYDTTYLSVMVQCTSGNPGFQLFTDNACQTEGMFVGNQVCTSMTSALFTGNVTMICKPQGGPPPTMDLWTGQCGINGPPSYSGSDSCIEPPPGFSLLSGGITYGSVQVLCGTGQQFAFFEDTQCAGPGPSMVANQVTCFEFESANDSAVMTYFAVCRAPPPPIQNTANFWNTCSDRSPAPSGEYPDECISLSGNETFLVGGAEYSSMRIMCNFVLPNQGFQFFAAPNCEGMPDISMPKGTCASLMLDHTYTGEAMYWECKMPQPPVQNTANFWNTCSDRSPVPSEEYPDECISLSGNETFLVGGAEYSSMRIMCNWVLPNQGFQFFAAPNCEGIPAISVPKGTCTSLMLDHTYTGQATYWECKMPPPQATGTWSVFNESDSACLPFNQLDGGLLNDMCQSSMQANATWTINGTVYSSVSINCDPSLPDWRRGFRFYREGNCISYPNSSDSSSILQYAPCITSTQSDTKGDVVEVNVNLFCNQRPPAKPVAVYRLVDQCNIDMHSTIMPSGTIVDGCMNAEQANLSYWAFPQNNNSAQYLSVLVSCPFSYDLQRFIFFTNPNCIPSNDTLSIFQGCLEAVLNNNGTQQTQALELFCDNSNSRPPANPTAGFAIGVSTCTGELPLAPTFQSSDRCLDVDEMRASKWQVFGENFTSVLINCTDSYSPGFTFYKDHRCTGPEAFVAKDGCGTLVSQELGLVESARFYCMVAPAPIEPPVTASYSVFVSNTTLNTTTGGCFPADYEFSAPLWDSCVRSVDARVSWTINTTAFTSMQVICDIGHGNGSDLGFVMFEDDNCTAGKGTVVKLPPYGQCVDGQLEGMNVTMSGMCLPPPPPPPKAYVRPMDRCFNGIGGPAFPYLPDGCYDAGILGMVGWRLPYFQNGTGDFVSMKVSCADPRRPGIVFSRKYQCGESQFNIRVNDTCVDAIQFSNVSMSMQLFCALPEMIPPGPPPLPYTTGIANGLQTCNASTMQPPTDLGRDGCFNGDVVGLKRWMYLGQNYTSVRVQCADTTTPGFTLYSALNCTGDINATIGTIGCLQSESFTGNVTLSQVYCLPPPPNTTAAPHTFAPTSQPTAVSTITTGIANGLQTCNASTMQAPNDFASDGCFNGDVVGLKRWMYLGQNYTSVRIQCANTTTPGFTLYSALNCTGGFNATVGAIGCVQSESFTGNVTWSQVYCLPANATAAPQTFAPTSQPTAITFQGQIQARPLNVSTCATINATTIGKKDVVDGCIFATSLGFNSFVAAGTAYQALQVSCANATSGGGFKLLSSGTQCFAQSSFTNMSSSLCITAVNASDSVNMTISATCKVNSTAPPTFVEVTPPSGPTITTGLANGLQTCNASTMQPPTDFAYDGCFNGDVVGLKRWMYLGKNYTSVRIQCANTTTPGFALYSALNCTGGFNATVGAIGCVQSESFTGNVTWSQVYCLPANATAAPQTFAPTSQPNAITFQGQIQARPVNVSTCANINATTIGKKDVVDGCILATSLGFNSFVASGTSYQALQVSCANATSGGGFKLLSNVTQCFAQSSFTNMSSSLCISAVNASDAINMTVSARCAEISTASPTIKSPTALPTTFAPTSSSPTSRAPTRPPTSIPSSAPSSAPTGRTPVLLGARLTVDLAHIEVEFDDNTNMRNQSATSPCAPWLQLFANDTGCPGSNPCPMFCTWSSPKRVVVDLNPQSNFNTSASWFLRLANDSFIQNSHAVSGSTSGTVQVTVPANLTSPAVTLSGPSVVSLCGTSNVVVQAAVTGTGGRAPALTWFVDGVAVPNVTTGSRLFATRPGQATTTQYQARVTNLAGLSANSSLFSINFTSDASAQVALPVSSFSVDATGTVDLSPVVNLPQSCIPEGFTLANANYSFAWKVSRLGDPQTTFSSGIIGMNRSRLIIAPASLLPPGDSYRIDVEVDPRIVGISKGTASAIVRVNTIPVIAVLSSSLVISTEKTVNVTIAAKFSCDPNRAIPICKPGYGQQAQNFTGLTFTWGCRDASNNICDTVCSVSSPVGTCVVLANTLTYANSPYIFFANVASSDPSVPSSMTPNATVSVLPDPPSSACIRPTVQIQAFPAKINVGQSGEAQLKSIVQNFDFNPSQGRNYEWVIVSRDTGLTSSPSGLIGDGVSVNQPNLVLQLSKLVPGASYVFRLVASLPCTEGSNAFGEVSFTTNTPPTGGVLSVSPMTGQAGLSDYSLFIDGATDEDLPLQYSFEYRTDFSSADPGNSAYFTLSAFAQSSSLTTRFAKASRILVIARIRDALFAVSPRAQSPSVDNVTATELVVTADSLPFNASQEVGNLLGSGGSQEDALRFASALAAAAASNGSADANSAAVVEWKQQTQTTLLNLVANTDSTDADPSFIMLQTTALSSILSSAENVQDVTTPEGQAFLAKATSLVGNLLENAMNAILAKSNGKDDPLLSQYRPGNLGDATLSNLKSILTAIQSSSLNSRRRRMRRLLRDDPARLLQAQQASDQVVTSVRDQLRKLADVLLLGAVSGSAPQVVKGAEMRVVAVSEVPDQIGTDSKLTTISVPAFNEADPPTVFSLPRNVLGGFGFGSDDLINILAIRFKFNIRELTGTVLAPNLTEDANGPINNITEMLALDFQRNASAGTLHPVDLSNTIKIRIPLTYQDMANNTKLACGFFNETLSTWSSAGCNVTEFSLPIDVADTSGFMICECNHASDYSAWMAFVKDVNSVFNPVDTSNLSTIAALVLGVLLPALGLTWIASQQLANYMDKRDSDYVHYGAFVAMTKRKLELHDRQRRFFRILKANTGPIPKADLAKYEAMADATERQREEEKLVLAFRVLSKRLLALVGLGSFATSALMFAGTSISFFFASNEASLLETTKLFDGAYTDALGVALTSAIVSALCGLVVAQVFLMQRGEISRGITISIKYAVLMLMQTANACLGLAAFSVPIVQSSPPLFEGLGTGLVLIVIGGSIAVVTFLFAVAGFFLHQLGDRVKGLGWQFLNNIAKGMVYEQTLVSAVSRFDPYFDRSKRFSIVLAVIVGNLFACSIFFSLRNGQGVSFGLVLASTVISSLIVAIPVKVTLRILFRVTKTRQGSKLDRIAHIFRITAFKKDVHPSFASEAEKLDVDMLNAFRRFYLAKQNVKLLKKWVAAKELEKQGGMTKASFLTKLRSCCSRLCSCGADDEDEADEGTAGEEIKTREKSFRAKVDQRTGEFEVADMSSVLENDKQVQLMEIRDLRPSQINSAILNEAKRQYVRTREELKHSVERSQRAWAGQTYKFSYTTRKQFLVQREKNAFLKWALAFAEEPHTRPKVTESILGHRWAILGWLVMFVYYVGCILWICFWIFSRNGQSRDALIVAGNPDPTNAEIAAQTNAYLLAWLGTSFFGIFLGYFVFEPALVILRFAVLPICLKVLRPTDDLNVEDVDLEEVDAEETGGSMRMFPKHLMIEDDAANKEEKVGCIRRLMCSCCSPRAIRRMEKSMVDVIILVIEALT